MVDRQRLLSRFLRYVRIDTMAVEGAGKYPSSDGQLELGQLIADEIQALGLEVWRDEHGIVLGTVPSTIERPVPVVAFNAHFDTSPETTGANVQPQVIESYSGGDLTLPGDPEKVIRVADNPELDGLRGCTLITTDGTTLLGADDKAGLAVIMELATIMTERAELAHGPVRLLFTCDEEIGRGVDHVDLEQVAATVCYTLDGPGANQIDVETFSADLAVVTVRGVNIHPSIAKDRMVNAIRAAAEFVRRLPAEMAPENTSGRDGFLHPYQLEGGVAEVVVKVLLRSFETSELAEQAATLERIASEVEAAFPGATVTVDVRKQYRNMREGLEREPRAVELAAKAHDRLARNASLTIIRGGTDGSQLTERGLPTPNLSTGQHNPHSPLEWACLDEMVQATELLVELVQLWGEA